MFLEQLWNDTDRGEPKYWGETSPIVASFLVRKKSLKILYSETLKNHFRQWPQFYTNKNHKNDLQTLLLK
jgi:hypothetical protein